MTSIQEAEEGYKMASVTFGTGKEDLLRSGKPASSSPVTLLHVIYGAAAGVSTGCLLKCILSGPILDVIGFCIETR